MDILAVTTERGAHQHSYIRVDLPKRDKVTKPDLSQERIQYLFAARQGRDHKVLRDKALLGVLLDTGLRIHEAATPMIPSSLHNAIAAGNARTAGRP